MRKIKKDWWRRGACNKTRSTTCQNSSGTLTSRMAVPNQSTTRQPVTIRGSALHTGNQVTLTVKPAAPNTGYVFKRVDLADQPTVSAHIDNVKQVERATTLGEGNVKIHTVEHLLSAQ